jgi:uncharacterized protein
MRLDLREIIYVPGASAPFDFSPDLSGAVSGSVRGIKQARAAGRIRNSAGVLVLSADIDAELECTCARCLREFDRSIHMHVENTLSDREEAGENPDIYVFEGDHVDVGDVIASDFILILDERILCREDCKGLCPDCGADLNDGPCACKKKIDPRLAALGRLLDDE